MLAEHQVMVAGQLCTCCSTVDTVRRFSA